MTMTTIDTSTRISAYSTIPWPRWVREAKPAGFDITRNHLVNNVAGNLSLAIKRPEQLRLEPSALWR